MRKFTALLLATVLVALFAPAAFADGFIVARDIERPANTPVPMAVKFHNVDVTIDNNLARTTIDQVFINTNNFRVEGTYMFPFADNAVISDFSMWIDGKEMAAELLEAGKARQIYEDIVRSMKDPALLEYVGTRMFKLRIFPIEGNSEKRIKLSYTEVIRPDSGLCVYKYPLNTEKFSSKPLENCSIKVTLKSPIPVKSVFSPTHAVDVTRKDDYNAVAGFEQKNVRPDTDFMLYYTFSEKDFGANLVTYGKEGEDGYFMLMLSTSQAYDKSKSMAKDVVFVLDVSGSMADNNKMEQARKSLKYCVQSLGAEDRFNIVSFATDVRQYKDALVKFDETSKKSALEYIEGLKAAGGTDINLAMETALGMTPADSARPFIVLFMTDGQPTVGERNPDSIVKNMASRNKSKTRVFSLGVGYDVNAPLLDKIAETTRSTAEYIAPQENIEIKVSALFDKISYPVLSEVALAINDIDTYDIYPRQLPDIFKGAQVTVFGRFKGAGAKAIRLTGNSSEGKKELVFEGTFSMDAKKHDFLPRQWASVKIAYLLEDMRLKGENAEVKQEIVRLAKLYGILTPYTSFLVLEDGARVAQNAPRGAIDDLANDMEDSDKAKAEEAKGDFFEGEIGAGAVATSRNLKAAKSAPAPASPAANSASGGGIDYDGGFAKAMPQEKKQMSDPTAIIKYVGTRTFYLLKGVWYDSTFKMGSETVKVKYLSDEYFSLFNSNPDFRKYGALGSKVVFSMNGKNYEIVE